MGLWRLQLVARPVRTVGVSVLAGIVAGLIVGGLGSRVVMRIVGMTAGSEMLGAVTDAGNRVGEITVSGTLELLLFVGFFSGVAGGLAYAAFVPWLARVGRWKGVAFGSLLLAVFGSGVIEADNSDFHRFGSPILNVLLFATLFILFGMMFASLAERFDRFLPGLPARAPVGIRTLSGYGLIACSTLSGLLFLGMGIGSLAATLLGHGDELFVPGALLICLLLVAPFAQALLARDAPGVFRAENQDRLSGVERGRKAVLVGYVVLTIPVLIGLVLTIQAIGLILRAAWG
jgi:hypothetical protein